LIFDEKIGSEVSNASSAIPNGNCRLLDDTQPAISKLESERALVRVFGKARTENVVHRLKSPNHNACDLPTQQLRVDGLV